MLWLLTAILLALHAMMGLHAVKLIDMRTAQNWLGLSCVICFVAVILAASFPTDEMVFPSLVVTSGFLVIDFVTLLAVARRGPLPPDNAS
jgi:hypothetical protein